jgi:hypothetical protein
VPCAEQLHRLHGVHVSGELGLQCRVVSQTGICVHAVALCGHTALLGLVACGVVSDSISSCADIMCLAA